MTTNSVTLTRVLKASPEKVYRAFTDARAMAAWLPPHGFLCIVHSMDVQHGGTYRMSFINFTTGHEHSFGGTYVSLNPNEFIQYTDKFEEPALSGEITTSVWMKKMMCGTELTIVQDGIPVAIPTEMCYLGWQESLDKLRQLVEPEIPDA